MRVSNRVIASLRRRPAALRRGALFVFGAVSGLVVSTLASYAVVSLLVPVAAAPQEPAPVATARVMAPLLPPAPRIVALPPSPPTPEPVRPVSWSAPDAETPNTRPAQQPQTPPALAGPENLENESGAVPPAVVAPVAVAPLVTAPVVTPPAVEAPVIVTFARPEIVPPARPGTGARGEPLATPLPPRAVERPRARPETGPDAGDRAKPYATLAAEAARALAPATIGFAAPPRPRARPEAVATAALRPEPDTPLRRPLPRPDAMTNEVAMTTPEPEAVVAMSPRLESTRPQPRPDVVRIASRSARATAPLAEEPPPTRNRASQDLCGRTLVSAIPARRNGAASGSDFFAELGGLAGSDRDARIIAELGRGNIPDFLRDLVPVTLAGRDGRGARAEIVICVTPDYLALGSDRDFVRVPLGLPAASRIAGGFAMTLPTPRMVDAIYEQARVRLSPAPMTPGPQMSSTDYFLRHNATIEGQRRGAGGLVSGHKKDVVMASRMANAPGRVAIYGWHRRSGDPIQPVSTVHGASYADYSHGIRLVSKTAYLNGRAVDLGELLASDRYAWLLNQDGPMPGSVIRIASR